MKVQVIIESDGEIVYRALFGKLKLESPRYCGNVYRALEVIEDLDCRLKSLEGSSEKQRELLKAVREFGDYITANQSFILRRKTRYGRGLSHPRHVFCQKDMKSLEEQR